MPRPQAARRVPLCVHEPAVVHSLCTPCTTPAPFVHASRVRLCPQVHERSLQSDFLMALLKVRRGRA